MRSLLVLALLASCHAGMTMSADVTISGSVGYAAMDEIPVAGGELRLVAPQVAVFEGVKQEVIGFPLKHTAITANVGGMMAVYNVEQIFENPFDEPIEAVYVFPLGDDGAVSGYEIGIGERTITGEIKTKEDARRIYDEAKSSGHTAGLVEQNKPNIFTQHIANIAPHETIKIRIRYVELLDYDNGAYTMAVPLTVGPRYLPADRQGRNPVSAASMPYVSSERASSTVSFTADIDAGVPIVGVESPSHDILATQPAVTRSHITLGRSDEIPNRDLVIRYKTAGPQTTVGLLTHKVDEDGYFMLAVQPKATYRTGDITPREVMIVIDRSGSMDGQPLAQAKAVASAIIDTLTERDSFNVVAFASGVEAMADNPIRGDGAGKQRGLEYLKVLQSGGGTEMEQGVVRMLTATPGSDRIRVVYFLTDGFVGNDDVVVGAAKRFLGTNRIFTVGIGSAPNRSLLDKLAGAGRGFASYLTLTESAEKLAKNLVFKSAYPYMTDVQVDWGGLAVEELTPAMVPDVYAGQPLIVTGRYRRPGQAVIKVSATTAGKRVTIPIAVTLPPVNNFEPVASLWARRKIDVLMDKADEEDVRKPVTELGLRFHLVTEFTSFVAVDRTRIVSNGQVRVVEQPSVVPEGVNPATTVNEAPDPAPSSSRRSTYDDGGGFGGWGGGGRSLGDWWILVFFGIGALWLIVRRLV
ncbi:MAG TPA: VIT domain-containing protein [Kofleriaceae bacterium]|nr:VIT domain-containing protein [Kofleriaceae bacterium]